MMRPTNKSYGGVEEGCNSDKKLIGYDLDQETTQTQTRRKIQTDLVNLGARTMRRNRMRLRGTEQGIAPDESKTPVRSLVRSQPLRRGPPLLSPGRWRKRRRKRRRLHTAAISWSSRRKE